MNLMQRNTIEEVRETTSDKGVKCDSKNISSECHTSKQISNTIMKEQASTEEATEEESEKRCEKCTQTMIVNQKDTESKVQDVMDTYTGAGDAR